MNVIARILSRLKDLDDVVPLETLANHGKALTWNNTSGEFEATALHNAVTLDANADTLLSLSTQALGLDTQTANTVLSGPTTGAAAVPTFRALVLADVTCLDAELDWRLRYGFMLAR